MLLRYIVVSVLWSLGFGASAQTPVAISDPFYPASAYWQSAENTIVTHRADLQQVIEFHQEFPPGTVIVVDQPAHYPWQLQSRDLEGDNFVFVTSETDVVVRTLQREVVPGLTRVSPLAVMVELTSGVSEESRLLIHYKRLRMPSIAYDNFNLPLLIVSPEGLQKVKGNALAISPKRAAKVIVSAPSLLSVGERFDVHLLVTDAFGNPIDHTTPTLEVMIDGVFNRRVPSGGAASLLLTGFVFTEQGVHQIDVRSAGGGVKGSSNVTYVNTNIANRIVWGDFHLHTGDGGFTAPALESRLEATHNVFTIMGRPNGVPAAEVRGSLASGGDLIILGETMQMAIASVPTDPRRLLASPSLAVEIVAGLSQYEWFGDKIAALGHRTTFFGSQTSHFSTEVRGDGKTALLVRSEENWQESLTAGNTYVVSEGKPILISTVNGSIPGSRITFSKNREIAGEVYASYALDDIELFKNGTIIDSKSFARSATSSRIQVKLTSPNHALPWDLPRNGREWIGYLKLSSGRINDIIADSYNRSDFRRIAMNPRDSRRVDFITWTHGGSSSFLLDIETDKEDLSIELVIMEGFEDMSQIPEYRSPSATRALRLAVNFNDLHGGPVVRSLESNGYSDQVEISLMSADAPKSATFRFVDGSNPLAGDYYYIRVRGVQDEMIWSSPVYVGGFDVIN